MNRLTAVILAGGMGTRLRSVVADRPKVLAEIHGRPFLCYLLDQLAAAGITQVVLCTGYMAEKVPETFGDHYGAIKITYSPEQQPLGTGGAVRLALPKLTSDPILVMNGDSFCDINLQHFFDEHLRTQAVASLALTHVADIRRYGAVDVTTDGSITRFEEKGFRSGVGLINAGIYLLPIATIATLPSGTICSLERDLFPALTGNGLHGFVACGRFIDIGIPEDYQAAFDFFSNHPIHKGRP